MYENVYSSITYNSPQMVINQMSNRTGKKNLIYSYDGLPYNNEKKLLLYATICMNLTNMKLSKEARCKKCL